MMCPMYYHDNALPKRLGAEDEDEEELPETYKKTPPPTAHYRRGLITRRTRLIKFNKAISLPRQLFPECVSQLIFVEPRMPHLLLEKFLNKIFHSMNNILKCWLKTQMLET